MALHLALLLPLAMLARAKKSTITSSASLPDPSGPLIAIGIPGETPDGGPFAASVVGVTSDTTTAVFSCLPGLNTTSCSFSVPVTVVTGPGTFAGTVTRNDTAFTLDCDVHKKSAACDLVITATADGSGSGQFSTNTTYPASEIGTLLFIATAGATDDVSTVSNSGSASSATVEATGSTTVTSVITTTASSGGASTNTTNTSEVAPLSTGGANALVPGAVAGILVGVAAVFL